MPKETFFNLPEPKRARIAELAVEEFAERPFDAASISRIVARAGIAKGSFYQYFHNKLDLYRWLLVDVAVRKKLEFLRDHPPASGVGFFVELEQLFMAGLEFGLAHPRLSRMAYWLWQAYSDEPDITRLRAEVLRLAFANMRAVLEQGQRAGEVRTNLDLDAAADLLLAMSREGLDSAVERRLGVSLIELCSRPELAKTFPPAERRAVIAAAIDLLRHALGTGKQDHGEGRIIDLSRLPGPRRSGP